MTTRIVALGVFALLSSSARAAEFEEAVPVIAAGRSLDVEHSGHAAPFVGDFDGDGIKDLLVGEFYKGRLRIYRNAGTNARPQFEKFTVFQDGAPGGCIFAS